MQIVIELSDEDYAHIDDAILGVYSDAIRNGIVLPNEHGDLVDRDMQDDVIMRLNENDWQITRGEYKRFDRILFEFPVVIPAEKVDEE